VTGDYVPSLEQQMLQHAATHCYILQMAEVKAKGEAQIEAFKKNKQ